MEVEGNKTWESSPELPEMCMDMGVHIRRAQLECAMSGNCTLIPVPVAFVSILDQAVASPVRILTPGADRSAMNANTAVILPDSATGAV